MLRRDRAASSPPACSSLLGQLAHGEDWGMLGWLCLPSKETIGIYGISDKSQAKMRRPALPPSSKSVHSHSAEGKGGDRGTSVIRGMP